jgi:hypothetical protein
MPQYVIICGESWPAAHAYGPVRADQLEETLFNLTDQHKALTVLILHPTAEKKENEDE